ncbi:MAG: hypothetical protein HOW97_02955 [Catenulispora sp.]|nr:hypothetical protein [Catenulispora sp.]
MPPTTAPGPLGETAPPVTTYTALLRLPAYLREQAGEDDETDFAVTVRATSAEQAASRAAGYLLWHFDTDYPDRAAAQAAADTVECIGVAEGEITFHADRPITLTADQHHVSGA